LLEELTAHIEKWSEWKPDALIFPEQRGAMLDGGNFRRRVFSPAAARTGVNERSSPLGCALRRAHGANVYAVQRMVGHSKPSITLDVYGELWDDSQGTLPAQLDAAIRAEMVA
jgi:integrase